MRFKVISAVVASAAFVPFMANAVGLSYTYVEGGWTQLQLDRNGAPSKPKLDGGYVRGSFAIAEQVHVFGAYSTVSKTTTYDLGSLPTLGDFNFTASDAQLINALRPGRWCRRVVGAQQCLVQIRGLLPLAARLPLPRLPPQASRIRSAFPSTSAGFWGGGS